MYIIETRDFLNCDFNSWKFKFDYHYVYILENGKHAYIGETKDVIRRAKEHGSNALKNRLKKYRFERIHIINSKFAEETPAKHFERLLIKLMWTDKLFNVVNMDEGEATHYERKNQFEAYFDDLWFQLEKKGLVKTKDFQTVLNSNTYKYSPYTVLTKKQHKALTITVNTINSGETKPDKAGQKVRQILLNGSAGTGKTVVATSLFYYLKNNKHYKDKKIALVYAIPAMREEIQKIFENIEGLNRNDVISHIDVTRQFYDIIICDEAHRLRQNKNLGWYYKHFRDGNERLGLGKTCDELDWILVNSGCQVLFYDSKQISCPSDISAKSFMKRLNARLIKLNEQMRIKAGNRYVSHIYDILGQKAKTRQTFENYDLRIFDNFSDMAKSLREKEEVFGLCRLCGGYAWKWAAKNDKSLIDISIDDTTIQWNTQTKGWLSNPNTKYEMGSIYTLAGLDLNYVGVVIGPELFYNKISNKIEVNKEKFYDNKVKKGVTDTELKTFILNTYAVLLTRGINGTYIYIYDDNLRKYFRKYLGKC